MIKKIPNFITSDCLENSKLNSMFDFELNKNYDFKMNKKDYRLWSFECFDNDERHKLFKMTELLNHNKVWYRL